MKILFCIDTMTSGGAERVIANLSNHLVENGHDVTILTLLDRECSYELNSKVKYASLKIREGKKTPLDKIKSIFENRKKYLKYLQNNHQDIIISFLPRASYYSAMVAKKNNVKLIISERNNPTSIYDSFIKKVWTKFMYKKADGFVFQTKMASEFFSKNIQHRSVIIPNPINDRFLTEPYSGKRKKTIVSVGRLTYQKNNLLLLEAFKEISAKHKDYKLIIYGDGPLRDTLESKIKEYGLVDKVLLPGISKNISEDIYDSSMFVLTSDYEGMPNALMEALALGIPSISTDCPCGGPRELIVSNEDGLLVPVNNLEKLVETIEILINDENKREMFSINSNKKMKKYNVNDINNKWLDFINAIIKNKNKNFKEKIIYLMGKNYIKVPDAFFLKMKYKSVMGEKLNLKNPQNFNEKLQWLKLYDRNSAYTTMVDKYLVRNYIKNNIGEEYLIPLYGVYDKFSEIDFSKLPAKFVIKCSHDSGGVVICHDKSKFDIESAKIKIEHLLKNNYFYSGREWPYKNVKPKIIIEKYMENSDGCGELSDYKLFCFNGEPEFTLVCSERFSSDNMCKTYFDNDWNLLPLTENNHRVDEKIQKPKNFELMKKLACKLSRNIPFVRIDFYEINNKVYFGEITFYPASGYEKFNPLEWNKKLGDMIKLPDKEKKTKVRTKKAIYNILSSLVLQLIILISGFIIPKLIIKSYGSNVNGLISSITQFLGYITLLEAGIGPVIKASLYKPIAQKDNKSIRNILRSSEKFFRTLSIIFLIYLIGLAFVYPLIVNSAFNYFYSMSLVLIISVSTFFEYYFGMTYKLYLQAEQCTYVTSIIQIVVYILNIAAVAVLVNLGSSIQIVKLISGFIFVLRPIIQNIYVKKKYNINLNDSKEEYKLEQKWDGLAQHIAAIVHNGTDVTILTIFSNLLEVSVYSVYSIVVKGVKSIVQCFTGGIDAAFGDMIARGENKNLNKSFNVYELFYYTIITIIYSCTIVLIVPFVRVYTLNIHDVNYIRPTFGSLMVIAEFVWSIRLPYSSLTIAAGHFKETRKGAWVEAIANIVVSCILVIKFGIIGVAIGTLVSMVIRTVEFIYHSNKYILKRDILISIKKVSLIFIETIIIVSISKIVPNFAINSYIAWFGYALMIFIISCIVTLGINFILYKKEFVYGYRVLKKTRKG